MVGSVVEWYMHFFSQLWPNVGSVWPEFLMLSKEMRYMWGFVFES